MIFVISKKILKILRVTVFLIVVIYIRQLNSQTNFTIIGLPDIQYYTENLQGGGSGQGSGNIATFESQINWIVNNRVDSNIVYVVHLGDCVQNGDNDEDEWKRVDNTMGLLENQITTGLINGIPYGIAVGNHDQSPLGDPGTGSSTTVLYNQYFGISRFNGRNYYAGHYNNDNDNHFDTISVGSLKLIFVYIEYGAYRDDKPAVDWADSILSAYSDRYGIIVCHKLMDDESGINVPFSTAGDYIYGKTRDNGNLFLMLCGHWTQDGRRTETRGGDSTNVYALMSDYQELELGGNGYMRIMKFSPTNNKIHVTTYSPTLDSFKEGPNSEFELDYSFPGLPMPVELVFFTGTLSGVNVELFWRTETEINNYGFNIERSIDRLTWTAIGFVEGNGNSNSPKYYNYTDKNIQRAGDYSYRLKQIDNDGSYEYSNIVNVNVTLSENYYLSQNYPNPFNPETKIDFNIPEKQMVTLRVYNAIGKQVAELFNEEKEAGSYLVTFDGSNLPSGIYIYRLSTQNKVLNKKMTLLK